LASKVKEWFKSHPNQSLTFLHRFFSTISLHQSKIWYFYI